MPLKRSRPKSSPSPYYVEMWKISWRETSEQLGLWAQIAPLILIIVVLFISIYRFRGLQVTIETIWSGYWPNILVIIILALLSPIWAFVKSFWIIPREYRKRQNEIKNLERKLTSEVINASVSLLPISLDSDKVYALLKVKNNEPSKKITGCRAKLTNFLMTCDYEGGIIDFTSSITAIEFPFFYWQENHDKQIDIEHADEKILCIGMAKDNKFLNLAILKDEYNFPAITLLDGKKFYEIRFKIELSGTIGVKYQVFYKAFCGKVTFTSVPIIDNGEAIFVDRIEFDEISEKDLVENF